MPKTTRISLVLLLVLLGTMALGGCGGKTAVSANQVMTDSLAALSNMNSGQIYVDNITVTVQGTVNGSAFNATGTGTGSGLFDIPNKKVQLSINMSVAIPSVASLSFPVGLNMYAVDNYTYVKTTVSALQGKWTKQALPVGFWSLNQSLNSDNLQSQLAGYLSPMYVRSEKVDGVACYLLHLTPDVTPLQAMLENMLAEDFSVFGFGVHLPDLKNVITNMAFEVWMAKDTSFLKKADVDLTLHIAQGTVGQTVSGSDMTVTLNMTVTTSRLNESVSITLPADAQNATEGKISLPIGL